MFDIPSSVNLLLSSLKGDGININVYKLFSGEEFKNYNLFTLITAQS